MMKVEVGKKFRALEDIITITINDIKNGHFVFYTVEASDNYIANEVNTIEEVEQEINDGSWEEIR